MGKRGSGKTTLSRKLQFFPRIVIFDRLHEYTSDEGKIVKTFSEFADAIRDTVESSSFKIIFQFDIEQDNHSEVFNQALKLLYYRGSVAIVIEEVWNFASPHFLPKWFEELLLTGRHRGCALITTSQRPAAIHKTILSQSHHIFCGTLHERNDLRYLSEIMGESVDQLPKLGVFRFLWFRPGQPNKVISN